MKIIILIFANVCWTFGQIRSEENSNLRNHTKCGIQRTEFRRSPRIIGGTNARNGEWPWQVALLQIDPRDGTYLDHHCGGVLVHQSWVLTSAHCLVDPFLKFVLPPPFWRVEVGKIDLKKTSRNNNLKTTSEEDLNSRKNQNQNFDQKDFKKKRIKYKNEFGNEYFDKMKVERIIIHQNFDQKTWSNDLALVKFSATEREEEEFVPVCLPQSSSSFEGYSCTVSGWGRTSVDGPFSNKLKTISVTVLKEELCIGAYKKVGIFSDKMFCAGDLQGLKGPCVGDSGSPLQCFDEESQKWVLNGITSWGYGCAKENYPAVYMKVNSYLDWINTVIYDS